MRLLLSALLVLCVAAPVWAQTPATAPPRPRILAHYMPWFAADIPHRKFGWHWTMGKRDPNKLDAKGRREIAAHDYPLVGVYDSGDPDVLEYHVLLMKIAGIDGVIADWYGDTDYYDYAAVHRNTGALLTWAKKANLSFAVCYEDQTVPKLIAGGKIAEGDAVKHGQGLLSRLETGWFADPAYLRIGGKPVFLVFGNAYYKPDDWSAILAPPLKPVAYFSQDEKRTPATGAFGWVHPRPDGNKIVDRFYAAAKEETAFVPAAYPGFHDYYKEAGVGESYTIIPDRDGKTLTDSLNRAAKSKPPFIQIATWNDWGEGTQIEPGEKWGYYYLSLVQKFRMKNDKSFPFRPADLTLPRWLYMQRKKFRNDAEKQKKMDALFLKVCEGKTGGVEMELQTMGLWDAKP